MTSAMTSNANVGADAETPYGMEFCVSFNQTAALPTVGARGLANASTRNDMVRQANRRIPIEASSGNVFADLGLPDAAELDTKVRLAVMINRLVAAQRLNQVTAAARLKVSQPKISALKNYRLDGLSVERLLNFLLALGQDVEIHVRPRKDRRAGTVSVTFG